MTGHTRSRQACIDIVFMARGALHAGMRTGQRERRRAMIERRSRPGNIVVAVRALLRESCLRVVRIRRTTVIGQMAGHTRG